MLRSIRMVNYRQYVDETVTFGDGLTVITGKNHAGKSTIFEAIAFAFFGTKALRDKAKAWIRDGCSDGYVVVEHELDGKIVRVFRDKDNAILSIDGQAIAAYAGAVTEEVQKLYSRALPEFRIGNYIKQKDLTSFSKLTPAKKRAEVERLARIDRVDLAVESVTAMLKDANVALLVLTAKSKDIKTLHESLERSTLERYNANELVLSSSAQAEQLQQKLGEIEQQLAELMARKQMFNELFASHSSELANIDALATAVRKGTVSVEGLEFLMKELEDLAGCKDNLEDAKNWHEKLKLEDSMRREYERRLSEVERLKAETVNPARYEDELKKLEEDFEFRKCVYDDAQRLLADANAKAHGITKAIEAANLGNCPLGGLCDSVSAKAEQRLDSLRTELMHLEEEAARLRSIIGSNKTDALVEQIKSVQKAITTNAAKVTQIESLRNGIGEEPRELCIDELDYAANRLKNAEAAVARFNELQYVPEQLTKERLQLIETNKNLECARIRLSKEPEPFSDDEKLQQLEAQKLDVLAELQRNKESCSKAQYQLGLSSAEMARLEEEIDNQELLKLEIDQATEKVARYNRMRDLLKLFKNKVAAKLMPHLSHVSNQLFNLMTNDRYAELIVSSDYSVSCRTHDGLLRAMSSLGGAEEDLANLALRMALGTAAGVNDGFDFAMLDEISAHFDDDKIRATMEGMLRLTGVFMQVLVITHRGVEEDFAVNVIHVEETAEGSKAV